MKIKIATLGTIISLACASTVCQAQDFVLTTINNKNSISTLSIDTFTGGCSDKSPMVLFETCTSSPNAATGETAANGTSTCTTNIEGLKTACGGSTCPITVWEGAGCTGNKAGTARLNINNNNITMSEISGNITYTGSGSEGTMTVNQ